MSYKLYCGINNIARNIKKTYVGVDGKARLIKNAHAGYYKLEKLYYNDYIRSCTEYIGNSNMISIGGDNNRILSINYDNIKTIITSNNYSKYITLINNNLIFSYNLRYTYDNKLGTSASNGKIMIYAHGARNINNNTMVMRMWDSNYISWSYESNNISSRVGASCCYLNDHFLISGSADLSKISMSQYEYDSEQINILYSSISVISTVRVFTSNIFISSNFFKSFNCCSGSNSNYALFCAASGNSVIGVNSELVKMTLANSHCNRVNAKAISRSTFSHQYNSTDVSGNYIYLIGGTSGCAYIDVYDKDGIHTTISLPNNIGNFYGHTVSSYSLSSNIYVVGGNLYSNYNISNLVISSNNVISTSTVSQMNNVYYASASQCTSNYALIFGGYNSSNNAYNKSYYRW